MTNQFIRKIPYIKPSITELEVQYATDAATNGWGEHCYDSSCALRRPSRLTWE